MGDDKDKFEWGAFEIALILFGIYLYTSLMIIDIVNFYNKLKRKAKEVYNATFKQKTN
jgi:hypothetical protein